MSDVLELIDQAIDDYQVGVDAMRWSPPVPAWDEPIVRAPRGRFEQMTHDGYDGYAALAVSVRAANAAAVEFGSAIKRFIDGMASAMAKIGEACRLLNIADMTPTHPARPMPSSRVPRRDDRPRWQSPYGPKPRTRRS